MGEWYSTCMLTGLPMTGGEPALLQFLHPVAVPNLHSGLAEQLFIPLGPPLPGICNYYGGVDPVPDNPLWTWQVNEWKALIQAGRLRLDPFVLQEKADDSLEAWARTMQWACVREDDIEFDLCNHSIHDQAKNSHRLTSLMRGAETGDEAAIAACPLPTVTVRPSYAVLWRPAADVCAEWPGHHPNPNPLFATTATWTHAEQEPAMMMTSLRHIVGLPNAQESDASVLTPASNLLRRLSAGIGLVRRSWMPSILQGGSQVLEWKRHVALLRTALTHAEQRLAEYEANAPEYETSDDDA